MDTGRGICLATWAVPLATLAAVVEDAFPWGRDRSPEVLWEETIVCEVHVKGIGRRHHPQHLA
ncbi:MAG: hypothetical protein OXH85_13310 [Truepera sp.]|nr:hypothetical protein [Truepera sp.]